MNLVDYSKLSKESLKNDIVIYISCHFEVLIADLHQHFDTATSETIKTVLKQLLEENKIKVGPNNGFVSVDAIPNTDVDIAPSYFEQASEKIIEEVPQDQNAIQSSEIQKSYDSIFKDANAVFKIIKRNSSECAERIEKVESEKIMTIIQNNIECAETKSEQLCDETPQEMLDRTILRDVFKQQVFDFIVNCHPYRVTQSHIERLIKRAKFLKHDKALNELESEGKISGLVYYGIAYYGIADAFRPNECSTLFMLQTEIIGHMRYTETKIINPLVYSSFTCGCCNNLFAVKAACDLLVDSGELEKHGDVYHRKTYVTYFNVQTMTTIDVYDEKTRITGVGYRIIVEESVNEVLKMVNIPSNRFITLHKIRDCQ